MGRLIVRDNDMNEHHDWALAGMRQDVQGITRDWHFVNQPLIHSVCVKQIVYCVEPPSHRLF